MSNYLIDREEFEGAVIEIYYDECDESPREWDVLGTMLCAHRRYGLGDSFDGYAPGSIPVDKIKDEVRRVKKEGGVVLPLYLYDHSGITMSTSPFSCPWDSGQVGYIVADKAAIRKWFEVDRVTKKHLANAEKRLEEEVQLYDKYIKGEVYAYVVRDRDGNILDSCGGFYDDVDEVMKTAKEALSAMLKSEQPKVVNESSEATLCLQ